MEAVDIKKASVHFKLKYVQQKLKVNKSRGKGHDQNAQVTYEYRNSEDILEAVKPLCNEVDAYVKIEVEPIMLGESVTPEVRCVRKDSYGNETLAMVSGPRFIAKATVYLVDCVTGESVKAMSFAAIDFWRKGQTEPEKLAGSADSYATKYALQHLFALDNGQDDPDQRPNATTPPATRTTSVAKNNGQAQAQGQPRSGEQAQDQVKQLPIERKLAKEAWVAFSALESVKGMTKEQKEKVFYTTLKNKVGKNLPKTLTVDEWNSVIKHLKEVKAA